ncbi:3TM-type holin [Sinorhizobium chiapasense]|uniref:3TM-type holin n=1 Tax=Sinorhizobium chiapasense TaxID=501572 RepID=A0ABZ2BGK7_9HYPH
MSVIVTSIILAAAKVGAPIVKGILEKHVGGAAGEVGGAVIDAIAESAGVAPEALPSVPAKELEAAVADVETRAPEIIQAYTASQRETNRLYLAEMDKQSNFGWMWRPAGMWLMLVCVAWYVMIVPLLNALLAALGAHTTITLIVDFASFVTIFMTYCGLYMGGNTILRSVKK